MAFAEPSYCCGCSLKTRAIIIGGFFAVISFAEIIFCIRYYEVTKQEIQNTIEELTQIKIDEELLQGLRTIFTIANYSIPITTVLSVPLLILSIILICGAATENPHHVMPWIVWAILTLILNTFHGIVFLTLTLYYGMDEVGTRIMISMIISGPIFIYTIRTVYCFYCQLPGMRIVHTLLDESETLTAEEIQDFHLMQGKLESQLVLQNDTPQKDKC